VLRLKPVREPLVRARLKKLEKEYRAEHPELDAPTYKAKTAGGEVYEIELDERSLEDREDPVQSKVNKARWDKHVKAMAEWAEIEAEQEYLTWLMYGVDCDMPADWEKDLASLADLDINIPDDEAQRRAVWLHYIALSLADRPMLRQELQIMALGNLVSGDQVESFRSGTRNTLESQARAEFDRIIASLAEGAMVGGGQVPGADGGEGVEQDTQPVGPAEQG